MIRARTIQSFDLPRATLLAGLIGLGLWFTTHPVGASSLEADDILAVSNPVALTPLAHVPTELDLKEDGKVFVRGSLGQFEGAWSSVGSKICLFFEAGPRAGTTCGILEATGGAEQISPIHGDPGQKVLPLN